MTMITRKSAIKIFSIYKVSLLSKADIENLLFAEYNDEESGEPIIYENIYDDNVQDFLIELHADIIFFGLSNEYLSAFLKKCFNCEFVILGDEPELNKCPCCGYLTLPERGQYDVCPVCLWEDDGRSEDWLDSYSTVNHSSLKDYRLSKLTNLLEDDIYYRKS
ncbi:hypothetical protein RIV76_001685 [Salmonella enterica]|nr:hypothetical protein [Salmonella enterica]EJU7756468.1 hypothetical protein [Salmonella enterica subsp. enterica serovar 11:b:1,7]ELC1624260.1 hypothetical protein [Salmonella enterica]